IQHGLNAEQREKVAQLYYLAFREKLHPIFRDEAKALQVLARCFNPDYAIIAVQDNEVVGVAGFKDSDGNLVDIQPEMMVETFRFFGGWLRILGLLLFTRQLEADILLMDGIVVDADYRGQGIGSQLLDAVMAHAREKDYQQVRLDVINTNPRARQLYERKGFIAGKTEDVSWLKPIFGFSASTKMYKSL
ncbi:MAG: GNAT family N-acetyltransferase, partial [Chloroflexota bacterium]